MANFLKSLILAVLVSFGATALAQCIPMQGPGPPRIFDPARGCYVPQGMQSQGYGGQIIAQPYYGGQQVVVTQPQYGYSAGVPMYGMGAPMAGGLTQCQALGGIVGGVLGSFARNYQAQAIILGAVGGGIVGNALCYNGQGQRVMVVPQQQVAGQYGPGQAPLLPPAHIAQPPQQQAPDFPGGEFRCPLRFEGRTVQQFFVRDADTCDAVVAYEARRHGWVRQ